MGGNNEIAFLGLGAMGFGMATNLLEKSFSVTGYDIYPPTLSRFSAAGGTPSSSLKEAVAGKKWVVFMVATAAQVNEVLFHAENGIVDVLEKGVTLILCSTGPPQYTVEVRAELDRLGRQDIEVVDAPVSGGTVRAANGTLTILASGPESSLEKGREVLEAMAGGNLHIISGGLGAGTKVKMVHQVLAGVGIVLTCEVMGFVAALGLDTKWGFEKLKRGEGWCWMFENRGGHMLENEEKIYSALDIIVKDVGIITTAGRQYNFPLPLSTTTSHVLSTGVAAKLGRSNDSELVRIYLPFSPLLVQELSSSPTATQDEEKLRLVEQVMKGINLVAAMEAMALGQSVGLNMKQLYGIIEKAAGSSWMFGDRVEGLLSGVWDFKGGVSVDDVISQLNESIDKARELKYSLHLAEAALLVLQQASLKGWGKEPDIAVCKVWDGVEGERFPRSKN